jgi:alpha-glucosidase
MQRTTADRNASRTSPAWWKTGVFYQIYPRSFQDSNGDGIGDLPGIMQRLDYLVWLGIDAVWLSPIFPSPMADFGYDVTDYKAIDPIFGTIAQLDALSAEIKQRGLKLLLDFVPNHTSDQHPWFQESRASRNSRRRDWYLWRDAVAGGPPNNWLSHFGGSAWEWDPLTRQYYYHSFLKEQPDLNWRSPEVGAAMHEVLRFWLSRGIDGFRIDVLWLLIKDAQFRDNPPNPDYRPGRPLFESQLPEYTADQPEVQAVVAGFRRVADEFSDRVLVGEIYLPPERLVHYYGATLDGVQLPFNFQLLLSAWNARDIAALIDRYEAALPLGGWPNWVLGNHDRPRVASRLGMAQARVAAMLLLTLRGTPTMYYGDELGMQNAVIPRERVQDPLESRVPGQELGRDPSRTPMQWDAGVNAGFSTGTAWLPAADHHQDINVEAESRDPASLLVLYRELVALRKAHSALNIGDYRPVPADGDLLLYIRDAREERLLVALNLGGTPAEFPWRWPHSAAQLLYATTPGRAVGVLSGRVALAPHEGIILSLDGEYL